MLQRIQELENSRARLEVKKQLCLWNLRKTLRGDRGFHRAVTSVTEYLPAVSWFDSFTLLTVLNVNCERANLLPSVNGLIHFS
jgi:hypothetical protein